MAGALDRRGLAPGHVPGQLLGRPPVLWPRLGPVGGRIVAEVLIGIIDADPASYRSRQPDWTPPLPPRGEWFELADMLIPIT